MLRSGWLFSGAFAFLGVGALAIAGCSSSGGTGTVVSPTPTPSPTPTISSLYNTMGNISCTAPNDALPGTYVNFGTSGSVTGNTYMLGNEGDNFYYMVSYAAGATPAPTDPPENPPPTPFPSETPTVYATTYYGEFSLPAFTDDSGAAINATNGCFTFVTVQPIGGTIGQDKSRRIATDSGTTNIAQGRGNPAFPNPYPNEVSLVDNESKQITAFTITNLTRTTGTGTFTIDAGITGTVTITGSVTSLATDEEDGSIVRRPGSAPRRQ